MHYLIIISKYASKFYVMLYKMSLVYIKYLVLLPLKNTELNFILYALSNDLVISKINLNFKYKISYIILFYRILNNDKCVIL